MTVDYKRIEEIIEQNFQDEINVLRHIISIQSVAQEPNDENIKAGKPFGEGVDRAYRYLLNKGESFGFTALDIDGYGGHLEFATNSDSTENDSYKEIFAIAAHLDCVPIGDGWIKDPLGGEIYDGKLFGRGAYDDKGPAIASLFAMRALREAGFLPDKRIRLILGLDEETECYGMKYYLENEEMPDMGFTPDGDFPVIHGEKGILLFDIAKKFGKNQKGNLQLRNVKGGEADNMVASNARALINAANPKCYEDILKLAEEYITNADMDIKTRRLGKSLEIKIKGIPAHGASPWKGVNAVSLMMEFLGNIEFDSDDTNDFIEFFNIHIGQQTDGENLGILLCDDLSGNTILNVGGIEMDSESAHLTINVRYPVSFDEESIYRGMEDVLKKYNLGIVKKANKIPLYLNPDSDFIKGLTEVYRDVTGDSESLPMVIGGGTYARYFDRNFVAFGAKFPGGEAVEHRADEYIRLDDLLLMTKIFAKALLKFTSD